MESTFSWLWIKEYASQDGNGAGAMAEVRRRKLLKSRKVAPKYQ